MVVVVVLSSGPDREPVVERPGEVVAGVSVHGLEEAKADPGKLRERKVSTDHEGREGERRTIVMRCICPPLAQHQRRGDPTVPRPLWRRKGSTSVKRQQGGGRNVQNKDLDRVSVLGGETEGRRVLVVDLVDVLVKTLVVHQAVNEVVPRVLEEEEESDLREKSGQPYFARKARKVKKTHLRKDLAPQGGEGQLPSLHADGGSERLEEVDLQEGRGEQTSRRKGRRRRDNGPEAIQPKSASSTRTLCTPIAASPSVACSAAGGKQKRSASALSRKNASNDPRAIGRSANARLATCTS